MIKVKRLKNKNIKATGLMATVPLVMAVESFQGTPEELAMEMIVVCGRVNDFLAKDKLLHKRLNRLCGPDRSGRIWCGENLIEANEVKIEEF